MRRLPWDGDRGVRKAESPLCALARGMSRLIVAELCGEAGWCPVHPRLADETAARGAAAMAGGRSCCPPRRPFTTIEFLAGTGRSRHGLALPVKQPVTTCDPVAVFVLKAGWRAPPGGHGLQAGCGHSFPPRLTRQDHTLLARVPLQSASAADTRTAPFNHPNVVRDIQSGTKAAHPTKAAAGQTARYIHRFTGVSMGSRCG